MKDLAQHEDLAQIIFDEDAKKNKYICQINNKSSAYEFLPRIYDRRK